MIRGAGKRKEIVRGSMVVLLVFLAVGVWALPGITHGQAAEAEKAATPGQGDFAGVAPDVFFAQPVTITIADLQDAHIFKNFDPNPIWEQVGHGNHALSAEVRFAPTGRDDPWRPAPGVIQESRVAIEFDLQPLIAQYPGGVGEVLLHLENWTCTAASQGGITLLGQVYLGDGSITIPDFDPTALGTLGQVRIPGPESTVVPVDVTEWANALVTTGQRWLGVALRVDYSTLPPRHTLATDTSFGCGLYAADSPHTGPFLVAAPGPARVDNLKGMVSKDDPGTISLWFTAPKSPGGQAAKYDLRYASEPLTDDNWETADGLHTTSSSATPKLPGETESIGLVARPGLLRYIAIRAQDPYGNWSAVSNNVMILETGFRPVNHGYAFANNLQALPVLPTDFTLADLAAILGDERTCRAHTPDCVPFVSEEIELAFMQENLAKGRCGGFTATVDRLFRGVETPGQFQPGAASVPELIPGPAISHYLSFYQLLQYYDPVRITQVPPWKTTPEQVLAALKDALRNSVPATGIGICKEAGYTSCHALLPVSVVEWQLDEDPRVFVQVVDPNKPGDLYLVDFHLDTNEVEFWTGQKNQMIHVEDLLLFGVHSMPGGGRTFDSLRPSGRALGRAPAATNFVARGGSGPGEAGGQPVMTWVSGWVNQAATDDQGRRLAGEGAAFGWEAGFLNEIPGAELVPVSGGVEPSAPIFRLPVSATQYTLLLSGEDFGQDGRTESGEGREAGTVFLVGKDMGWEVGRLKIEAGEKDTLTIRPDGTLFSYQAEADRLGVDLGQGFDLPEESWRFTFNAVNLYAGQPFTLTVDLEAGTIRLDNHAHGGFWTSLEMEKRTAQGSWFFRSVGFPVDFEDIQQLAFGAWDGTGPLTVQVDHGGDGTVDEVRVLENILQRVYLPMVRR